MATLADSLVSSASRPLTLRMRPDLTARRQRYHGQSYWVVKEPIGLNYFRFHEEEYAILCMLDGRSSLESIKERFEEEFTPQKITFQDLQQFVGMLHRSGLVVADAPGQGQQLREAPRREETPRAAGEAHQRLRLPLARDRPRVDPQLALSLHALVLLAARGDLQRAAGLCRPAAGHRPVRRLPLAAADVPPVLRQLENWLVMGIVMAGGQGPARVRPRAVLQALRRRMPRDGLHAPGVHALPVLQRLRLLDAAQQVASGGHRRGRHVRRDGAGVDRHLHLVVQRSHHAAQPAVPERDVHLLGQHGAVQRQSAVAVRRLLHPDGPDRDSQPAAEVHRDPEAVHGAAVPGHRTAGEPVPAAAEPVPVRPVHGRRRVSTAGSSCSRSCCS